VARFLSTGWVDDVTATAESSDELAAASRGVHLTLQQEVTTDEGAVRWWFRLDDGAVTAGAGEAGDGADVVLRSDAATATAIATGAVAAHDAVAEGYLRVSGDIGALRRAAPALAAVGDVLGEVRARTEHG
jgi:putative sterol carrier protein